MFGFGKGRTTRNLSPVDVSRMMSADAVTLVDVREPSEWVAGHIPGAVLAPLSTLDRLLPILPRDKLLVFMCRNGIRSVQAVGVARDRGFDANDTLEGGLAGWQSAHLPLVH